MELTVNGESRDVQGVQTIADLLALHNVQARTVVVEHNRDIIPRDRYADTRLQDGDRLEIVQMMAGG